MKLITKCKISRIPAIKSALSLKNSQVFLFPFFSFVNFYEHFNLVFAFSLDINHFFWAEVVARSAKIDLLPHAPMFDLCLNTSKPRGPLFDATIT